MSKMFCTECHAIGEGKFCPECGFKWTMEVPEDFKPEDYKEEPKNNPNNVTFQGPIGVGMPGLYQNGLKSDIFVPGVPDLPVPSQKLRLRQYKSCDSQKIASWIATEDIYRKWGGDRFGPFPVSAENIDAKYRDNNGDCTETDNFYPWTAFDDENGVVGSFIMRYLKGNNKLLRFGWVIVDASIRGKGYGSKMLTLGLKYAFEILGVCIVTIGAFEGNTIARNCYKKVGFSEKTKENGDPWNVIEMEITKEVFLGSTNGLAK